MKTLIQLQEATLARMAEPRTSEARALRNRSRALRRYKIAVAQFGFTPAQAEQQARDLRDLWELHRNAEGVE